MRLHPLVKRWDRIPRPFYFMDAVQRARQNPSTFVRVDAKEIRKLVPGWSVKVCIKGPYDPVSNADAERFWVIVSRVFPRFIVGMVANDLTYLPYVLLKFNDVIAFQRRHILDIDPRDEPMKKEGIEPESNQGHTPGAFHMPISKQHLS